MVSYVAREHRTFPSDTTKLIIELSKEYREAYTQPSRQVSALKRKCNQVNLSRCRRSNSTFSMKCVTQDEVIHIDDLTANQIEGYCSVPGASSPSVKVFYPKHVADEH